MVSGLTTGKIPKAASATSLTDSLLSDDGTNIKLASGQLLLPAGTAALPAWAFTSYPTTGVYSSGANKIGFATSAGLRWELTAGGDWYPATTGSYDIGALTKRARAGYFGGNTKTTDTTANLDISITLNDAGTSHRVAKIVAVETATAASTRYFEILGGASGTTDEFYVAKTGAGYFAGTVNIGGAMNAGAQITSGSGSYHGFYNLSRMYSPADGVIELTNAGVTDFSRLQFGGTTSSFPSLKRSAAGLVARLADDSADTTVTMSALIATASSSPASGAACTAGTFAWDASYIYVCTASGAWKRAALAGGY